MKIITITKFLSVFCLLLVVSIDGKPPDRFNPSPDFSSSEKRGNDILPFYDESSPYRHSKYLTHRDLFELESPFVSNNKACRAECFGDLTGTLPPMLNLCPKCEEQYKGEHCNSCCYGGASSLKIRWYGCAGEITFSSLEQSFQDCGLEDLDSERVRFVDCECYDEMVQTPGDSVDCELKRAVDLPVLPNFGHTYDICVVSVQINEGSAVVDLAQPLPSVIGLVHANDEDRNSTTYFDTTCDQYDDNLFVLPIFPGYGKFANSCKYILLNEKTFKTRHYSNYPVLRHARPANRICRSRDSWKAASP